MIRIREVVSTERQAYRGSTAGSGATTTEMKLVMRRIILRAMEAYPTVAPSCFVDDLSAGMAGRDEHILRELGGSIRNGVNSFIEAEMELSKTKSNCSASTDTLGKMLEELWGDLCISYQRTVKSLGVGPGAGRDRNTKVMSARIKSLAARIHKFRMLKQVGIDTSMLLRTGGKQVMTYGLGIIGVSDSMLRDMRRTAAAIAALASGTGGTNLDAALILADGGPSGMADPAFDARLLPIGKWPTAVCEEKASRESLHMVIAKGRRYFLKNKEWIGGMQRPWSCLRRHHPQIEMGR